jgi:hypothetical protein
MRCATTASQTPPAAALHTASRGALSYSHTPRNFTPLDLPTTSPRSSIGPTKIT